MSSKIITTVLLVMVVAPFAYIVTVDAVSIKQNLQARQQHVDGLKSKYADTNRSLKNAESLKNAAELEANELDKQKTTLSLERQRLERMLGAN